MLGDKYLLIKDRTVIALDTSVDRFFEWELPIEILAAADYEGKTVFYSNDREGGIFAFTLGSDCDSYYLAENGQRLITEPIEAYFTALLLDMARCGKLYELSVDAASDGFTTELFDDDKLLAELSFKKNRHRLFPSILFHKLYGRFSFSGGTLLYNAELKYSKLTKL